MQSVTIDESLEKKLLDIVARAAQIIKDSPFHIDEKDGPVNIVTTNDVACQEFLYKELSPPDPRCGIPWGGEPAGSESPLSVGYRSYRRHRQLLPWHQRVRHLRGTGAGENTPFGRGTQHLHR